MKIEKIDPEPVKILIQKHLVHTSPYEVIFKDVPLTIYPGVFDPTLTKVSGFLTDNINIEVGDNVLDMFTGSGAIALLAAQKANFVMGIDISPVAISCAQNNAMQLGFSHKTCFRVGNLWDAIVSDRKFNVITANPPLLPAIPETAFEKTVADSPEMKLTSTFVSKCSKYLHQAGRVYMSLSNACEVYVGNSLQFIETLALRSGLIVEVVAKLDVGYEVYRILQFQRR